MRVSTRAPYTLHITLSSLHALSHVTDAAVTLAQGDRQCFAAPRRAARPLHRRLRKVYE